MISKKELLEKIVEARRKYGVIQSRAFDGLADWASSIPDQPTGEAHYPGSHYQPLFDHMSQNHNLTLLQGEMDEIIRVVRKMDEPALLPFQWPVPDGMEVVTMDGRKVGQVVRFEAKDEDFPLIGVLDGLVESWTPDGLYSNETVDERNDLFLRPIERKVWVVEFEGVWSEIYDSYPADKIDPNTKIYEATLKPVK